jgi:hypothetical protein
MGNLKKNKNDIINLMKQAIYQLIFILLLTSCSQKKQVQENSKSIGDSVQNSHETSKTKIKSDYQDTIRINYLEHKEILSILAILPDSTMRSWSWKTNERKDFVRFIEKNNFAIDTTKEYNNITKIKCNSIKIQVVDGSWVLSIYKIKSNNYIVITDDIVGDGNDIMSFEYNNGKLTYIELDKVFGDYFAELLIDKNKSNCTEFLNENKIGFEYNFEDEEKVFIENSWNLKEENNNCLKGNTLAFTFNRMTKKFDLTKVYWTKYKQK